MLAVIAPGQGAQKPGFLAPWLDLPNAAAQLRWWSEIAGVDLIHLGTEADSDEIRDTAKTQPLLVAAALVAAAQLPMIDVGAVAGHSVGEVAAAALAGVLSPEAAIAFAALRGREMARACGHAATGMSAVVGGDAAQVLAAIEAAGLFPANRNGAGQIVAAGERDDLAKLAASPPAKSRVMSLTVAGAFHTPYMRSAQDALASAASGITTAPAQRILLANADGVAVGDGPKVLDRLVCQVTAPVRWDLCMHTLADLGVSAVIELPPAGTLAGLLKRELKGKPLEIVTLDGPDSLNAARDLISRHSGAPSHEPTMEFVVAVATAAGTFEPAADLVEGVSIKAGQVLGYVVTRQGKTEITAHESGQLTEWLASSNDPVSPGQPIVRIGGTY